MEAKSMTKWFRVFGQCVRCGEFTKAKCMLTCQQCHEAKYCSRQCQEDDTDDHKETCHSVTNNLSQAARTGQEKSVSNISEDKSSENTSTGNESVLGTHSQQMETQKAGNHFKQMEAQKAHIHSQSGNILLKDGCKLSTDDRVTAKCEKLSELSPDLQSSSSKKYSDIYHDSDKKSTSDKKDLKQEASGIKRDKQQVHVDKPKNLLLCAMCGKKRLDLLICARCHFVAYCSKECQRQHYPEHKKLCRRYELFEKLLTFLKEQETPARLQSYGLPHSRPITSLLVTMFDEYMGCLPFPPTSRPIIAVQIVGRYAHWFRQAVVVEDVVGQQTHAIFHDEDKKMGHITIIPKDKPVVTTQCELAQCLKPGNFMVLMDAFWHHFMDGTMGIRVDDLDAVQFIHME